MDRNVSVSIPLGCGCGCLPFAVVGLPNFLAGVLSWKLNHDVILVLIHFVMGWFYLGYKIIEKIFL